MKIKNSMVAIALASATLAHSQINYSFTVGPDDTLSDVYIFNVNTFEKATAVTQVGGAFTPLEKWSGSVNQFGPVNDSFLVLFGVFTNIGDNSPDDVAVSLPQSYATTLINEGGGWDTPGSSGDYFNSPANFGLQLLPDEATALSDVENGHVYTMAQAYAYLNDDNNMSNVLTASGALGTVTDLDGAQYGGSFSFSPAPEPTSLAVGGFALALLRKRSRRSRAL